MALYIEIKRTSDTPSFAEYTFGATEERVGKLKLDKSSGEVALLQCAPGDDSQRLYSRASHKIKKHWAEGQVPEVTCWAS